MLYPHSDTVALSVAGGAEQQANGVPSGASTPRLQLPAGTASAAPPAADGSASSAAADTPSSAKAAALDGVLQKDAFLAFRALCKLSIKTADASSGTDLTATRGKVGSSEHSYVVCSALRDGASTWHDEPRCGALSDVPLWRHAMDSHPG